jgi:hypothetical protein
MFFDRDPSDDNDERSWSEFMSMSQAEQVNIWTDLTVFPPKRAKRFLKVRTDDQSVGVEQLKWYDDVRLWYAVDSTDLDEGKSIGYIELHYSLVFRYAQIPEELTYYQELEVHSTGGPSATNGPFEVVDENQASIINKFSTTSPDYPPKQLGNIYPGYYYIDTKSSYEGSGTAPWVLNNPIDITAGNLDVTALADRTQFDPDAGIDEREASMGWVAKVSKFCRDGVVGVLEWVGVRNQETQTLVMDTLVTVTKISLKLFTLLLALSEKRLRKMNSRKFMRGFMKINNPGKLQMKVATYHWAKLRLVDDGEVRVILKMALWRYNEVLLRKQRKQVPYLDEAVYNITKRLTCKPDTDVKAKCEIEEEDDSKQDQFPICSRCGECWSTSHKCESPS